MYYQCQKSDLKRGASHIDSSDWIKNKKATINPENNDAKCFQYTVTVAINHEKIIKYPQRIAKPKSFINNYN